MIHLNLYVKKLHKYNEPKVLLTAKVTIILHRLACQLIEKHLDFTDTILVEFSGCFFAERLKKF
jgi:pyrimidine operon attenuation protein/uracil phosphoribosyltransferase